MQEKRLLALKNKSEYAVEMLNITKTFGSLYANDDVTLRVKKGEIHAVLGENGAGKSTLMSVLFGLYQADSGIIKINGEEVEINNPNDANDHNIGMVHQHFKLVDVFTVLENIILGKETRKGLFLDLKECRKKVLELSEKYGLEVDLDAYVKDLTVSQQQKVEILKMLYRDADILIFDEPTAVLTPQEIESLMKTMKNFSEEGKTIILITHKLNEIKAVADRCTILRRGKYITTIDVSTTSVSKMAELMVGRVVNFSVDKDEAEPEDVVLSVRNLSKKLKDQDKLILNNVSFDLKAGEIVCLAGIDGNGQSELVNVITGLDIDFTGEIIFNGEDISKATVRKRIDNGMSHIPEDRQKFGLVLNYTIAENMITNQYYKPRFSKNGILKNQEILEYTNSLINEYDIRTGEGAKTFARSLSGGNQQKAIFARETSKPHNLLIASQPTRGLDVGAIEFVHKTIVSERDKGKAIFVVSFELDEVTDLADRILVIYEGAIVGELNPKKTNHAELGLYMLGTKQSAPKVKAGDHNEYYS